MSLGVSRFVFKLFFKCLIVGLPPPPSPHPPFGHLLQMEKDIGNDSNGGGAERFKMKF